MTERADERLWNLTVEKVLRDVAVKKLVDRLMEETDHQLVMPPDHPRVGDEYLGTGCDWTPVSEKTYTQLKPFGSNSFIVRRPTEHLRMFRFFFGGK